MWKLICFNPSFYTSKILVSFTLRNKVLLYNSLTLSLPVLLICKLSAFSVKLPFPYSAIPHFIFPSCHHHWHFLKLRVVCGENQNIIIFNYSETGEKVTFKRVFHINILTLKVAKTNFMNRLVLSLKGGLYIGQNLPWK